jgi:23S rRNA pseudouridine1911/1915/1917 synthase
MLNYMSTAPELNNIVILYEDDDIIVVNKPSGIKVHEDGRTDGPTVVEWFLTRAPAARGVGEPGKGPHGEPLERSGVVHRLDRDTSGVLLLVKNSEAFTHMKAQFHDRLVKKEYRAFVYGTMKEKWGTIHRPIGRSASNFKLRSADKGARGLIRDAVTDWELIGQSDRHAYLRLLPKTGRMHQLRVHLKSISRPIVGDTLYAPESQRQGGDLGFSRLALHAYCLTLTIPSGEQKSFIAPIPYDFEVALNALASDGTLC